MPNTPLEARFLTEEERQHALQRMRLDSSGATEVDVDEEKFDWYWVKMALLSPQTYFCAFIWFFLLIPLYVSIDKKNFFIKKKAFVIGAFPILTFSTPEFLTLPSINYCRNEVQVH
jgi:hypothetical protein